MKAALFCPVFLGTFIFALSTVAAPGDVLFIQGDQVNIRHDPNTSAAVMMQLDRGHQLLEIQRDGDWVNVGIEGAGGQDGWVHGSLVGPGGVGPGGLGLEGPAGETAPAAITATATGDPRFVQFRREVLALNAKAYKASGANHFTAVSDLGDGIVRVTATESWVAASETARQKDMDTLFDLWDVAEGTGLPIMVQVVDGGDNVVMTRSRR